MLHMAVYERRSNDVGVRELRQNLSVYLDRVRAGETLRVTDRGEPVATLSPLPQQRTWVDDLVVAGLATPAKGDLIEFLERHPPIKSEYEGSLSDLVSELREERLP